MNLASGRGNRCFFCNILFRSRSSSSFWLYIKSIIDIWVQLDKHDFLPRKLELRRFHPAFFGGSKVIKILIRVKPSPSLVQLVSGQAFFLKTSPPICLVM